VIPIVPGKSYLCFSCKTCGHPVPFMECEPTAAIQGEPDALDFEVGPYACSFCSEFHRYKLREAVRRPAEAIPQAPPPLPIQ
jgi:hypothetical protein